MKNKRLTIILSVAVLLLLIPFIAMQFTTQVDWKLNDFIVMGSLLFGVGLLCELVLRKVKSNVKRAISLAVVLLVFLLVWAELAVGIFGTPLAGS